MMTLMVWILALMALPIASHQASAQFSSDRSTITITLAGDTGFAPNHAPVNPRGVSRHGRFQTWADTTSAIAPLINGDLNFLNVETVVTARNTMKPDTKGQRGPFNFRTHPNGIRHLVSIGFNVLSLANNHSMDYGVPGLKDSLQHIHALRSQGLKAAAGIGMNREEASRPQVITIKGARIAFAAIGIVTNNLARHRAGPNKPGQIAYRFNDDFDLILKRLASSPADFRILSIHYGLEGRVRTDPRQIKDWRRKAALTKGIDLIVGHHAHVPRAIERAGRSLIFYGLGNFLHHGTANMSAKGICRDFGILARVHLMRGQQGRLNIGAVEAIPLTSTHRRVAPMPPAKARTRIAALNTLAGTLPRSDRARGVRFAAKTDGTGLHCFAQAAKAGGHLGALCAAAQARQAVPVLPRDRRGSCAR